MHITITSKGQMTLPKKQREALGLKAGSQLTSTLKDGNIVLTPQTETKTLQEEFAEMFKIVPKAKPDHINGKGEVVVDSNDKETLDWINNG